MVEGMLDTIKTQLFTQEQKISKIKRMRKLKRFYFLFIIIQYLCSNSFGQLCNKENFAKMAKSYIEFQYDTLKSIDKNSAILIIGASSIDKDSIHFGIYFMPSVLLFDMKYDKVYEFEGFKLIIIDDKMDKSYILKGLFKETAYIKFEKVGPGYLYHPKTWYFTLNKKNEVVSVESDYYFKDVVRKLKKNRVKFAKNFHFIQNLSWQTDDR
jgi:hypothetical protein